jgi:hypothetical protein
VPTGDWGQPLTEYSIQGYKIWPLPPDIVGEVLTLPLLGGKLIIGVVSSRLRRVNGCRLPTLLGVGPPPELLGAPTLLSLGQAHEATGRIGPSIRKILVLVGVLILSVFALIFAGKEAQAEQLPQQQQQPVAATDRDVVEPVAEQSSVKISLVNPPLEETSSAVTPSMEAPPGGTSPVEAPPVDGAAPPVSRPVPQSPVEHESKPVLRQPGQDYPEASPVPDPAAPTSGPTQELPAGSELDAVPPMDLTPEPESGPEPASPALEPVPGPVLEPVAFEENEPLSSYAEEAPVPGTTVPNSGEEQLYLLPGLEDSVGSVVETVGSTSASAFEALTGEALLQSKAAEDKSLIGPASTNLFSVGEIDRVPTNKTDEDPGSSPTGPESPLRDTPQPVSPFAPPVGNSFSLSGGSAIGPGGLALLLLCILVSGVILLRRDGKVLSPICKLPKPDSALRLPLERPG